MCGEYAHPIEQLVEIRLGQVEMGVGRGYVLGVNVLSKRMHVQHGHLRRRHVPNAEPERAAGRRRHSKAAC